MSHAQDALDESLGSYWPGDEERGAQAPLTTAQGKPAMSFSILNHVIQERVISPRKILLHGVEGVGKTTWACKAPKPFLIATEPGSDAMEVPKLPSLVTDWQIPAEEEEVAFQHGYIGFLNVLRTLARSYADQSIGYKTIIIDSVDWLERIIWEDVCANQKWFIEKCRLNKSQVANKSITDFGYGKGYDYASDRFSRAIQGLNHFTSKCGAQVILIAHTTVQTFQDPQHEPYDRYTPKLHKKAGALLKEWCDEILFANWKTSITTTEEGFDKQRHRGHGTGERIMLTEERPAYVAKNRISGMPHELPLSWEAYSQYAYPSRKKEEPTNEQQQQQPEARGDQGDGAGQQQPVTTGEGNTGDQ